MSKRTTCTVPNCGRPEVATGLCNGHYTRRRNWGDVRADIPLKTQRRGVSGPDRLWLDSKPQGDCIVYTGGLTEKGYGFITWNNRRWLVHRMAWLLAFGPVPDDLTIDHLCSVRNCINVDHLEPVTQSENCKRAQGWLVAHAALRALTTCRKGLHPWTPDNIGRNGTKRYCRECKRISGRRADAKRRSVAA